MSDLLDKVKARMTALGVPYSVVGYSERPDKKICAIVNGRVVHFGLKGSKTFLEGASELQRKSYIARHRAIRLKDGSRAIDRKYSSAWMSMNVLWI